MPNKKSKRNNKGKQTSKHQSVPLFYWKGTAFPQCIMDSDVEYFLKNGEEMVKNGLMFGEDINTQIQDYTCQLDMIEELICKYCNPVTKQGLDHISRETGEDIDHLNVLWALNICALLHLGVIENDNLNGYMVLSGNAVSDFIKFVPKK